jgi:hypothetical protein
MTVRGSRKAPNLIAATEKSIKAAQLDDLDSAAAEAMRLLARKIQAWDTIVDWALDAAAGAERPGARPAVPQNDNVSLASYLKYCESLGLTPASRDAVGGGKKESGGKLAQLRAVANRTA